MPILWEDRHKLEAKMRFRALRYRSLFLIACYLISRYLYLYCVFIYVVKNNFGNFRN